MMKYRFSINNMLLLITISIAPKQFFHKDKNVQSPNIVFSLTFKLWNYSNITAFDAKIFGLCVFFVYRYLNTNYH